jgi:hypothetical protein
MLPNEQNELRCIKCNGLVACVIGSRHKNLQFVAGLIRLAPSRDWKAGGRIRIGLPQGARRGKDPSQVLRRGVPAGRASILETPPSLPLRLDLRWQISVYCPNRECQKRNEIDTQEFPAGALTDPLQATLDKF